MDGMQSALAGLPAAGVYLLGAALAAGLGGAGFVGAQSLAPGAHGCRRHHMSRVMSMSNSRTWH